MSAPMRPGDVTRDASLGVLAGSCSHHVEALVEHARGLHPLPDLEVTAHALAALSYGRRVTDLVESGRWSTAARALIAGAGLERTAAAMGWDLRTVRIGLGLWVSEQHRMGLVDTERYEQVVDLIREEPA